MPKIRNKPRPEITIKKQSITGPIERTGFLPGISGNPAGRPKGSRHKLTGSFLTALNAEFDRRGVAALQELDAPTFIGTVAKIIPVKHEVEQEVAIYVVADRPLSDDEWAARYTDPAPMIEVRPENETLN